MTATPTGIKRHNEPQSLSARIRNKSWHVGKALYARLFLDGHVDRRLIFLMGSNSSGGTTLLRYFDSHIASRVFGEVSPFSIPGKVRLRPADELRDVLNSIEAAFLVAESKAEVQNAAELLRSFPRANVVWIYRNYKDIAVAAAAKFNCQIRNIRKVLQGNPDDWRAEGVPTHLRDEIENVVSGGLSSVDAAALFWYVRNSLFFEQALAEEDRALLCRFEDVTIEPALILTKIYSRLGVEFKKRDIRCKPHSEWIGVGRNVKLSREIDELCSELAERLNACDRNVIPYKSQDVGGQRSGMDARPW